MESSIPAKSHWCEYLPQAPGRPHTTMKGEEERGEEALRSEAAIPLNENCHGEVKSGLTGWLSWLEHHPDIPRLRVPSPVRAHMKINQWMHQSVEQQIYVLCALTPSLALSINWKIKLKINQKITEAAPCMTLYSPNSSIPTTETISSWTLRTSPLKLCRPVWTPRTGAPQQLCINEPF